MAAPSRAWLRILVGCAALGFFAAFSGGVEDAIRGSFGFVTAARGADDADAPKNAANGGPADAATAGGKAAAGKANGEERKVSSRKKPFAGPKPDAKANGAEEKADDAREDKPDEKAADKDKEEKAEEDAEAKKEMPAPAKPNPIGNLLRRLLPPRLQPAAPVPGNVPGKPDPNEKKPANGDSSARDAIDARAPYDRHQSTRIKAAQRALGEKNWRVVIEALQAVLDQPQDSLVRRPDGRWVSVRGEASRMLSQLPKEALDLYELQFGPQAKHLLAEGQTDAGRDSLAEAATRYFHTRAGQQAADRLAARAVSRGEWELAAEWYRQLLAADSAVSESSVWRLRAAAALHRAGDLDGAAKLRDGLKPVLAELAVAGNRVDIDAWWKKATTASERRDEGLDEWPMLQGNTSRTATAAGGEPLLLPRWSIPLTANLPVREQIAAMVDELSDQKKAAIAAMTPIMIDDKAIFRTLRGFAVVDVGTGKTLWETREGISAESLVSGTAQQQVDENGMFQFNRFGGRMIVQNFMYNGMGDQNPLVSLLFRDGNYGNAVCDARRLYVVEKLAVLSRHEQNYGWWNGGNGPPDPFNRDWSSNRIAAYDLQTGRPLWETGGEKMHEAFDLPLAGTFFYGAPLADGEELFAVGEESNDIRLHALDALTGKPIWSQLIAVTDAKIENDFTRRRWIAPVTAGNGVLVCPTTVGWLVAVDRTRRGILWAYRYSEPQANNTQRNFNNFQQMTQAGELNTQWAPSAPRVVGNRVIFAPPEDQSVVCLNLADGSLVWKKPKEDGVYVAGVFGDRVVIAGKSSIRALNLADGENAWTQAFAESDGRPCGHGVAVEGRYHLPLSAGQLWTLSLADGRIVSKSYLPTGAPALGNLAMYRGLLLSLSSEGLTAFEQKAAVDAEIARRKAANPRDGWALLREADIALLKRDFPTALDRLKQVPADTLDPADRVRYRRNMLESLAAVIRSDFTAHDAEAVDLAAFVASEPEKMMQQRLAAERSHVRKDYEAALRAYLALIERPQSQIVSQGGGPVRLRLDLWLAGRLTDLWADAPEDVRAKLDAVVFERANAAAGGSPDDRRAFCRLFEFHPQSIPIRRRWIEDLVAAGRGAEAELQLLRLGRHRDAAVAAAAGERLARLWAELGYPRDAEYQYQELERRWPDVSLADGRTVKQTVTALRDAGALAAPPAPRADWGEFDVRMQRLGANYVQTEDSDLFESVSRLPYFRERRFRLSHQAQRLAAVRSGDDVQEWNVALRSSGRTMQGQWAATRLVGHSLFVLNRDMIQCLSPLGPDPKTEDVQALWTYAVDNRGASSGYYRQPNRWTPQQFRPLRTGFENEDVNQNGMMAAANERYVCVYGRREFTLLDPATGETLWTRGEVPLGAQAFGTADVVFLMSPGNVVALRALDGKPLDLPGLTDLPNKLVRVSEDHVVLQQVDGERTLLGLRSPMIALRAVDPLTGENRWPAGKLDFPSTTQFTSLGSDALVALHGAEGVVERVDLVTGERRALGKVDQKDDGHVESDMKNRTDAYAFQDAERTYVLVNHPRKGQQFFFGEEIPTIQANGVLVAFDTRTGKRLWKAKVEGQSLVVSQLSHSPALVFSTRTYINKKGAERWEAKVMLLDKATGRALFEAVTPSSNGFRALEINMADGYLELKSYNERYRFLRVARAAGNAPEAKP